MDVKPRTTPLLSGHKMVPFEGEEDKKAEALFPGHSFGMVRLEPGGTVLTPPIGLFHDRIMNFKFQEGDTMVMTYPKCGTTWMQEIVWTMVNNPDLDNPMSDAPVNVRCPFMELDAIAMTKAVPPPGPENPLMVAFKQMCPEGNPQDGVFIQMAENLPKPRTVKTHLPFSLIPSDVLDKAKVVYVVRNPKDIVVSFMHHCRIFKNHDYQGNIKEFVDMFVKGDLLYGHYDRHLKEALDKAGHKNLYIVKYEDLKADPTGEIKKLDEFLGTKLSEEQIGKVVHHTSFEEMKKRDNVAGPSDQEGGIFNTKVTKTEGGFFRKGEAGNWKQKLSMDCAEKIDKWTKEKFSDIDIKFSYGS